MAQLLQWEIIKKIVDLEINDDSLETYNDVSYFKFWIYWVIVNFIFPSSKLKFYNMTAAYVMGLSEDYIGDIKFLW